MSGFTTACVWIQYTLLMSLDMNRHQMTRLRELASETALPLFGDQDVIRSAFLEITLLRDQLSLCKAHQRPTIAKCIECQAEEKMTRLDRIP